MGLQCWGIPEDEIHDSIIIILVPKSQHFLFGKTVEETKINSVRHTSDLKGNVDILKIIFLAYDNCFEYAIELILHNSW